MISTHCHCWAIHKSTNWARDISFSFWHFWQKKDFDFISSLRFRHTNRFNNNRSKVHIKRLNADKIFICENTLFFDFLIRLVCVEFVIYTQLFFVCDDEKISPANSVNKYANNRFSTENENTLLNSMIWLNNDNVYATLSMQTATTAAQPEEAKKKHKIKSCWFFYSEVVLAIVDGAVIILNWLYQ